MLPAGSPPVPPNTGTEPQVQAKASLHRCHQRNHHLRQNGSRKPPTINSICRTHLVRLHSYSFFLNFAHSYTVYIDFLFSLIIIILAYHLFQRFYLSGTYLPAFLLLRRAIFLSNHPFFLFVRVCCVLFLSCFMSFN